MFSEKVIEYPDWPPPKISKYRTTANATAVQFNGALCMHCTRGCFTADISTELRADFQMENEILQCRFVISESLAKMVRHWTTDQRAWIVARKNRGDTLAEIQACFIQCQDRRKKRKAGREGIVSVLTQQNIDQKGCSPHEEEGQGLLGEAGWHL